MPSYQPMWDAVNAVRVEHREVHVACTPEWLEAERRITDPDKTDWTPGPYVGSVFGVQVFVTDDVESPDGWEARPGPYPGTP